MRTIMKSAAIGILIAAVLSTATAQKGGWSGWSEWSSWGKGLCSGNQRIKTRTCTNPLPNSGSEYCDGENAKQEDGPVDGGLSDWTQWSTCEKPCGGSIVNRTRVCDNPPPSRGGSQCSGKTVETKMECVMSCPESKTDGSWSPWSDWTSCPKHCTKDGGSSIKRYRQCNMPPPMFGGKPCPGNSTDEIIGCFDVCPVDGGFNQWSSFTPCSKTCGNGLKSRYRLCNDPIPQGSTARNCTGAYNEVKHCRLATCEGAVNGNWGSWNQWSSCSQNVECFKGVRSRKRSCSNPAPNKGGDDCLGTADESEICPKTNCKDTRPTPPSTLPVHPGDYIHRECGGILTKKIGSTAPQALLNGLLSFGKNKFIKGYFAEQKEEKDSITKYCFEPWPPLTIKEAGDRVPSYYRAKELPNFKRPTDTSFPIPGFSIRVHNDGKNTLKGWDFGVSEVYEYVPGNKVKLHDVMFTYYSEGSHWGFLAKGNYELFKPYVFASQVFYNSSFDLFFMKGKSDAMALRGILNALGVPDDVGGYGGAQIKAIKNLGLWDMEFKPASIAYDFRHEFKAAFRMTATMNPGGVPIHFEIIYVHSGFDRKLAFGFQFDGESYGAVLDKMSGAGSAGKAVSDFLNKLGVQIEVGVAYCPSFFGSFKVYKTSSFSKQPLKEVFKSEITEGLTAAAQVSIPKDCGDSSFCTILKKLVGPDAKFRITGVVRSAYYKVAAGFYKIRIYKDYQLSKLELNCEVNTTSRKKTLGFTLEFKIPVKYGSIKIDGIPFSNDLKLGGKIKHKIGSTAVSGTLYMKGMWYHAFGLRWLNFGNINLGLTLDAKSPILVSGFELGATVDFGTDCFYAKDFANDGHCLRFAVYFGVGKPSYFYGKIAALTIGKIARMVGGGSGIPGPVASTGFPDGLEVSYNAEKDIDLRSSGGPFIRQGFRLKGTLDLFGYQIKAEIVYSEREILLDGELDPINLGGHVVMARNATHKHVGPKLTFHYKSAVPGAKIRLPYFKMYFEGYVKILGIEVGAYLNITMQQMEIYIYGKVWDLIYCEVYVAAAYDYMTITDAHFYIRVIVDLRGLTDAIEKARKAVDQAFKHAQQELRNAVDHVQQKKRECKEKLKIKCSNCYKLKCKQAEQNCKGFLDKAGKWIGGVINAAGRWVKNTVRKIGDGLAKVGRAVKSFFKGWRRRRSLMAQRDENFHIHVRNRRFISKFICEGIVGGGCRGVSHLCYGTCKAVDFIGQGLCHTLDIAVGVLKLAEKACGWINSAIQFLMQMFLIHGIRFELGLGQKFNGFMVGAGIDLTLFGNRMYFEFQFDLKNPLRSITNAKDGSLYRYKQGVRQLRTELTYNPYDRPNPFADFDLAGTFGIEALQTGTENRLGGCIAALTKGDNGALKLLACNEKDERQRWTYTLHGRLINLYSKKCVYFGKSIGSGLTQFDCEKGDKTRMEHECDVVTRTLKLRRNDLCLTMAQTSNIGPGSISHHGSMKCIHLNPSNRLVIRTGCGRKDTEFKINDKGHIIFVARNLCARPVNGRAVDGVKLELTHNMAHCHKFEFTTLGSIRHAQSRLCIQTPKMEMKPNDYTELVLGQRCEHKSGARSIHAPADQELTFTFMPQDTSLKMKECGGFYDTKIDQRFAVMNEELNSVCSKYAKDIAVNKIASQSSIKHNGFPSRAVDGNFNFQWEKGSCMHTNEERDPWWRVDLGKEYIVTDVTIINRGEHGDRFKDVQVHVGQHLDIKRNPVCHDRVRQAQDGEAIRLTCDPPIPGQFVGVQMYGKGILSMCEVVVASRLGKSFKYLDL
ncbi:uncharacterized protein [Clytia hemisphaerica]|uniref:uncharacterized protein n=1 Tax=Clytia hemisphaerica TaxID=252671 RepID=UPI0034D3BA9A